MERVIAKITQNTKGMTIEEIFKRGEISIHTRNICFENGINTIRDLQRHYLEKATFSDLRVGIGRCNNELIGVCKKHKNVYRKNEITRRANVDMKGAKLEDVITDLDVVKRTTRIADVSLVEMERKLQKLWKEIESKEPAETDTLHNEIVQPTEDASVATDIVDERSIEQRLADYWSENAAGETAQKEKDASTIIGSSNEVDVVDLDEVEQTLKPYRNEKIRRKKIDDITLEEVEKMLSDYWERNDMKKTPEQDA